MNLLDLYGNNDPYGISSMYDGSGGGGGGGGGYDAAPPLTLQDLWSPTAMPQYPQAPTLPNQWTDLGPQDQQQIAKRSLMLMTARALAQPGQLGSGLLQGALAAQQMQGGAVDQARQDAMREYAMARQNAEQNALATRAQNMDSMRQREAQAALGVYNRIVQNAKASGADPDTYNQIESQARAAAMQGDAAGLQKIMASAPRMIEFNKALLANGMKPGSVDAELYMKNAEQAAKDRADLEKQKALALYGAQVQARYREPQQPRISDIEGVPYALGPGGVATPFTGPGGTPLPRKEDNRDREKALAILSSNPLTGFINAPPEQKMKMLDEYEAMLKGQHPTPTPPPIVRDLTNSGSTGVTGGASTSATTPGAPNSYGSVPGSAAASQASQVLSKIPASTLAAMRAKPGATDANIAAAWLQRHPEDAP